VAEKIYSVDKDIMDIELDKNKAIESTSSKNIVLTFSTSILLLFFSTITGILTARLLGPSGKGTLTAVIIWPAFLAAIGSLGITEAITYFTAKSERSAPWIYANGVLLALVQSSVLICIGIIIFPFVFKGQGSRILNEAYIYLLFIPLNLLTLILQALLGGKLKFKYYNLIRIVVSAVILAGLVVLAVTGRFYVINIILLYLLANSVTLLTAWLLIRSEGLHIGRIDIAGIQAMLSYGLRSHLGNISAMVNERLDQLIISIFLIPSELGLYAIAVTLTTMIVMIGSSIAIVAFPSMSNQSSNDILPETLSRYTRITFFVSASLAVIMTIFISPLINLLFGPAYLPAVGVTRILLFASVALSVNRVLQAGFKSINRPWISSKSEVLAVFVTLVALLILLPRFGILGAGIASTLAYSTSLIYLILNSIRIIDTQLYRMLLLKKEDIDWLFFQWKELFAK
jgi:O-antigen/teichoic acid export membrane protein